MQTPMFALPVEAAAEDAAVEAAVEDAAEDAAVELEEPPQAVRTPAAPTTAEAFMLEIMAHFDRIHKQANVLLMYFLCQPHPCHQQVGIRSQFLWQLFDAMK